MQAPSDARALRTDTRHITQALLDLLPEAMQVEMLRREQAEQHTDQPAAIAAEDA